MKAYIHKVGEISEMELEGTPQEIAEYQNAIESRSTKGNKLNAEQKEKLRIFSKQLEDYCPIFKPS